MTSRKVPRERIPWYPPVRAEACSGCRVCFEFCQHGAYAWDGARNVAVVERPFNCLVGCSGCEPKCPAGAICFPDMETISDLIKKLRDNLRRS